MAQDDEQAIRESVETWLAASKKGDLSTLLDLLADDVLFIVPGKEPFGKEEFATGNQQQMKDVEMDATIDIKRSKSRVSGRGCAVFLTSLLRVKAKRPGIPVTF